MDFLFHSKAFHNVFIVTKIYYNHLVCILFISNCFTKTKQFWIFFVKRRRCVCFVALFFITCKSTKIGKKLSKTQSPTTKKNNAFFSFRFSFLVKKDSNSNCTIRILKKISLFLYTSASFSHSESFSISFKNSFFISAKVSSLFVGTL